MNETTIDRVEAEVTESPIMPEISDLMKEYLKKVMREMPFGVCLEMFQREAAITNARIRYHEANPGEIEAEELEYGKAFYAEMQMAMRFIQDAIDMHGAERPMGTSPGYNEEAFLNVAIMFLENRAV